MKWLSQALRVFSRLAIKKRKSPVKSASPHSPPRKTKRYHEGRSSLRLRVLLQNAGEQAPTPPVRQPVQNETGRAALGAIQGPLGHQEPQSRQRLPLHQNQLKDGPCCERSSQGHGPQGHLQVPPSRVHHVDRSQRRLLQIR